jgi:predicted enzyme related to lactoylglutathione lyase
VNDGERREPSMIEVRDIHAMVVFSDDPRRLADWYRKVFRARPLGESDEFCGLNLGGLSLFVQRRSEGHSPGLGGVRPHLTVDDCEKAVRALLKAGAEPLMPVQDAGEEWVAAVRDPEGNPIGLLSFKR